MLAVVQIGGHQYIVSQGDKFRVDGKVPTEGNVVCDKVLLVTAADGKDFQVGTPYIDGMTVECKVVGEGKSKKVRVFKMQPKKRHQTTHGHRQHYVDLEVMQIGAGAVKEKKPKVAKAPAVKKAALQKAPVARSPKKTPVEKSVV